MLAVAVCLVACLSIFNLLLTLALARRTAVSGTGAPGGAPRSNRLPDGSPLPGFTARTLSDGPVTRDDLSGELVIGFFSSTCRPCLDQAPEFAEAARERPGGRAAALAVVQGGGPLERQLLRLLDPVARVVVEPAGTGVAEALGITVWPSFLTVDAEGRITDRGPSAGSLPTIPARTP
ncbi:TlpA disulfide reductase family protein [Kitasatospora sp. NPDC057198]|uniref:TlpA disulfide reductase family protein n=1 Tax=Kitasatospora sp. NPDC057198 TaxID=3346046 RepID=UPI003631ACC0